MTQTSNHRIYRTAEIRETPDSAVVALNLVLDADSRYRWHQAADGADTEVSGPTIAAAIEIGAAAWRTWDFRVSAAAEVREFVESHEDDDEMDADELRRIFALAYDREPDSSDEETGLWSLICASV